MLELRIPWLTEWCRELDVLFAMESFSIANAFNITTTMDGFFTAVGVVILYVLVNIMFYHTDSTHKKDYLARYISIIDDIENSKFPETLNTDVDGL